MITYNPKQRITAAEALNDPWITNLTKNKVRKPLNENILKNLQVFNSERKLQSAIFQFIANQLVSKEEEHEIKLIFEGLDENGDGVLSKQELVKGVEILLSKFGTSGAFKDVDDLISKIDFDGNGTVDIMEFIAATINFKEVANEKFLRQAFNLFDLVRKNVDRNRTEMDKLPRKNCRECWEEHSDSMSKSGMSLSKKLTRIKMEM